MAAHRYWRAVGIETYGLAGLDITEFQLIAGTTRVDTGATLTSSAAPAMGSLANFGDDDTGTGATWSLLDTKTLILSWDFGGSPQDVTDIRLGSAVAQAGFPLVVRIDYSDDAVTWATYTTFAGITWPGTRTKTASVFRYLDVIGGEVVSYASMEGANGSTSVSDRVAGKSWTLAFGATLSTAQKKTGDSSLLFNGSNGYAEIATHTDFNFGSSDWTIEFMAYLNGPPSDPGTGTFMERWNVNGIFMNYHAVTRVTNFGATNTTSGTKNVAGTNPIPLTTWTHIAFVRNGTNLLTFVNGVLEATSTGFAGAINDLSEPVTIGRDTAGNRYISAYLDEWRVIKGKAQYTAAFNGNLSFIQVNTVRGRADTYRAHAIPTNASLALTYGTTRVNGMQRARPDYVSGLLGQGIGRVRGFTLDYVSPLNKPYRSHVRLIRESDGKVVRDAWTGADGSYDFQYVDELQSYTVVAYYVAHGKRAVITDGLTLANGKVELMA